MKNLVRALVAVAALGLAIGAGLATTAGGSPPAKISAAVGEPRTDLLPAIPSAAPIATPAPAAVATPAAPSEPTPVPPPVSAPSASTVTAPPPVPVVASTTTTTQPVAQDGPQPATPGVTTMVTECVVTLVTPYTNPDPLPQDSASQPITATFAIDCSDWPSYSAAHPTATMSQNTYPITTSPGTLP